MNERPSRPKTETDNCRSRLAKYCRGQGVDLGCGASKIKIDAVGVDLYHPDAEMRKDARVMDYFPDKNFDYVYSSHLLEEIENTEATLKEWLRVLKDGGYLVLYQADKDIYFPIGDPKCNSSHRHHFGWEDLWTELEKIGGVELIHHDRALGGEWSFELVVRKSGHVEKKVNEPIRFKFMVVGGPAEKYIDRCLSSIANLTYQNWQCQVVLDPVGDKTYETALKYQSEKIKIKLNEKRLFTIANLLEASRLLQPSDDDVLVTVDADDWLSSPEVLSILASYYIANPKLLVTHGSWEPYPNKNVTNNGAYLAREFEGGIRTAPWKGSHLRTCKYKIWKNIKDEDLRDAVGNYFTAAGDLALVFPMLEMAGPDRVKFIPEVLYIYNQETEFMEEKVWRREQLNNEAYMRRMPAYARLENVLIPKPTAKKLNTVIFSKDRACQLDALLRSVNQHWTDWKASTEITVVWTYRSDEYLEGYKKLMAEHPGIKFISQKDKDFKETTLSALDPASPLSIFLVDDMLFINSFSLNCPEVKRLENDEEMLCLSLRMHPKMVYCYMLNIPMTPPDFSDGAWKWKGLPGDFGYVKSLDAHLFRTADIMEAFKDGQYTQPNALEETMLRRIQDKPYASCFQYSKVVNIPSNSVGANVTNRHGNISEKFLNDQYLAGKKIDITPFSGMITKSCHMELEYTWK